MRVRAMRRLRFFMNIGLLLALSSTLAYAGTPPTTSTVKPVKHKVAKTPAGDAAAPTSPDTPRQIEVTADQSLEWYQDQSVYVARGNAKAVRGDMVVEADTLMAHQPEKDKNAPKTPKPAKSEASSSMGGDIDRLTADGNVRITDPRQKVTGGHAVYDMIGKVMVVTGGHLKYETEKETVTARDSLEYYEDKLLAVARGNAVGIKGDRHIEGDVLTAEFRNDPNGQQELYKMTSTGNVVVVTKSDISRGDHMVYDASRNIAVLTGHVRITRPNGMQLAGDVGEVDFANNTSRLLNQGGGRVRALLPSKSASADKESVPASDRN